MSIKIQVQCFFFQQRAAYNYQLSQQASKIKDFFHCELDKFMYLTLD